jgi:hypothetical protein
MASPRRFPFDDDDRPSGSVQPLSQADLQAILAHLGDDPDELLAGTAADRPMVAVRVRATVGRPGGSAQARWRRLRAAEWAAWTRTLPWRMAAIAVAGVGGGLLGSLLTPRLVLVLGGLAAVAAGWGLRFRPSPDAVAWRRGAAGERRTARLLGSLERQGWAVLHDLAVPGSRANIDHLVIGPGGVFVIDSKQYSGRLQLDSSGRLWHGRYPLAPTLRAVSFEADQAAQVLPDPGVVVVPMVAVHGAQVPWGKVVTDGCRWWRPGACPACFASSRPFWGPSGSPAWPTRPGSASTPPPNLQPMQASNGATELLLSAPLPAQPDAHLGGGRGRQLPAGVVAGEGDAPSARAASLASSAALPVSPWSAVAGAGWTLR